jgi:hypothetical protein
MKFLLTFFLNFFVVCAFAQWNNGMDIYNTTANNVGIGTSTPAHKLTVDGNIINTAPSVGYIGLSGDLPGYGNNIYPTLKTNHSEIHFSAHGKYSAYLGGPDAAFGLNDASATTKVLINSNGNSYLNGGKLGIGTMTPEYRVHIQDDAAGAQLKFKRGTGEATIVQDNNVNNLYLDASAGLFLNAQNSGYVGIGTTTPGARLEVKNTGGSQLKLSGGTVAGGIWTNAADILYMADWNTGNKGIAINMTSGNVGIGTTAPGSFKLAVEGKIGAREINCTMASPWPDYVFEKDYKLPALSELQQYIGQNKHLPEIPTAAEVAENGVNLGEMHRLLLKKVEELTLYVIEQNNKIEALTKASEDQQKEIQKFKLK